MGKGFCVRKDGGGEDTGCEAIPLVSWGSTIVGESLLSDIFVDDDIYIRSQVRRYIGGLATRQVQQERQVRQIYKLR